MIFIEPQKCYENRMLEQKLRAEDEARRRNVGRLTRMQDDVMFIVREHNEPEIRNTTLGRIFAKIPGYKNRQERDNWIKVAWQHMTALIKMGLLEWAKKRNHVRLAPPEKHQAYLAGIEERARNLPKPRL